MNVLDFPTDIWAYILDCYLGPEDTVSLLQVCKAMFSLCSSRSVWMRNIKEAAIQDDLYIHDQGGDLRSMKRTTLTPARMVSTVIERQTAMDEEKSKIYPVSQRILPFEANDELLMMLILPGGRYVVVKTTSMVTVVDVLSTEPPPQNTSLETHDTPISSSPVFLAGPSNDGSKFRIAIAEYAKECYPKRAISILEFDPAQAELRRIASHNFNESSSGLHHTLTNHHADTLSGDLFAFFDTVSREIYVWNFVQDRVVSWRIDPSLCDHRGLRKIVVDTVRKVFIVFAERNILFWELDDVISIKKSGRGHDFPPKWRRSLDVRDFSDPSAQAGEQARRSFLFSLNIWYHSRHPIPGFDFLIWDRLLDHTYSYTYEISYDVTEGAEPGPTVHLTQMHLMPHILAHNIGIKHNRLCAGQTVLVWERYDDNRLFVIIKPSVVNRNSSEELKTMTHAYEFGAELVYISGKTTRSEDMFPSAAPGLSTFDPTSGRLCTTLDKGRRIVLSDYIGDFGL